MIFDTSEIQFIPGQRGSKLLSFGGYTFVKNRATEGIIIHIKFKFLNLVEFYD